MITLPHGVYPTKSGKFIVQIHQNGKNYHVSTCDTIEQGVIHRNKAMKDLNLTNRYHAQL